MNWKRPIWALVLVGLPLVAYLPAAGGDFIWDDDMYVVNNQALRTTKGLYKIWFVPGGVPNIQYYPLTLSSFWLEYHAWGLKPTAHHWVNICLHALNALLLWLVLRRLAVPGAWLAAAVFALHPVHVESVAWITERKNVLSGFFYLAALWAYLHFVLDQAPVPSAWRHWRWYILSLVLFLAALLSKTIACSLPAALVLLLWWQRGRLTWRDLLPLVPFFALGVGLGTATVWIEKDVLGGRGWEFDLSPAERCLIAGRALWFYAGKLFWPEPLAFVYARWHIDTSAWWQYLFPIGALFLTGFLWAQRRRWGRGPLVAVLFFGGTLIPALGFFNVYPMRYSFVADHFQYLASIGLIALAAAVAYQQAGRLPFGLSSVAPVFAGAVLLVLAILTWEQCSVYKDLKTLWTDTIRKDPECWMAHGNLASVLGEEGKSREAVEHLVTALRLYPRNPPAHYDLGVLYHRLGNIAEAKRCFATALEQEPHYARALQGMGTLLIQSGELEDGADHFARALALNPNSSTNHFNLGTALAALGRLDEARDHFEQARGLEPTKPEIEVPLGVVLLRSGDVPGAVESFRRAVELRPDMARYRFYLALGLRCAADQAGSDAEIAAAKRNDRRWPVDAIQLAWTLATHTDGKVRNGPLAVQLAEEACGAVSTRVPMFPDILAAVYAENGSFDKAVETARAALEAAQAARNPDLAREIEGRLALYRSRKPFREQPDAALRPKKL
jgi:tetratricopeptide (TPR) repeat protein